MMKTKSLGFIGSGRITKILLHAFQNENAEFSNIVVTDLNREITVNLSSLFPYIKIAEASVAAEQDIVFISLHPPVIVDTLELLKNSFRNDATVISLAPKISLEKLSARIPHVRNIVRLIPNATSYLNKGYNPVCFASGFPADHKNEIMTLLSLSGITFEVPEIKLESYAILSAMLPTYFWFQWKVLEEIGQKIGLDEKESQESIYETLKASLDLMYKSGLSSGDVIDLIPVKPISEHEEMIRDIYRTRLIGLFEKIKP